MLGLENQIEFMFRVMNSNTFVSTVIIYPNITVIYFNWVFEYKLAITNGRKQICVLF